tara:strand:+ start:575 stop:757 length:183 start_codon:yes stop_codon:yes gene_type:complete
MKIKEKLIKLKHRIENNYKDTSREQWYWVKYHIDDLDKGDVSHMTKDTLKEANKLWKEYV